MEAEGFTLFSVISTFIILYVSYKAGKMVVNVAGMITNIFKKFLVLVVGYTFIALIALSVNKSLREAEDGRSYS